MAITRRTNEGLIGAGASDDKDRAAAEERAGYRNRLALIDYRLALTRDGVPTRPEIFRCDIAA